MLKYHRYPLIPRKPLNPLALEEVKDHPKRLRRHLVQVQVMTTTHELARAARNPRQANSPRRQIINRLDGLGAGERSLERLEEAHAVAAASREVELALEDEDGGRNRGEVDGAAGEQRRQLADGERLAAAIVRPLGDAAVEVARLAEVHVRLGV